MIRCRIRAFPSQRTPILFTASNFRFVKLPIFSQTALVTDSRFSLLQIFWPSKIMDCTYAANCWNLNVVYFTKRTEIT